MYIEIDHPQYIDHCKKMIDIVVKDASKVDMQYRMIDHAQVTSAYCAGYLKAFKNCRFISNKTYNNLFEYVEERVKGL